jgi:hypothetical protein
MHSFRAALPAFPVLTCSKFDLMQHSTAQTAASEHVEEEVDVNIANPNIVLGSSVFE